ncbi:MAG: hypothetical protein JO121_02870 [Deltaproteobacteria bacterium]|jgi:hypothetical protein|nr:hypothetical protein [Deltaproteobacteria bacterium]
MAFAELLERESSGLSSPNHCLEFIKDPPMLLQAVELAPCFLKKPQK